MHKYWLLVFVLITGCHRNAMEIGGCLCSTATDLGNGQVVRVLPFAFTPKEINLIGLAAHSWDQWGVNLFMDDELSANDVVPVIYIRSNASCLKWNGNQCISLDSDTLWDEINEPDLDLMYITTVAHEFGHAIGLAHVAQPLARMYPYLSSKNFLLTYGVGSDNEEFCRVYPTANVCVER